MTARVTFNRRWHRYALDGKRVPGVTTAVGILDKGGLAPAAARETAAYAATHAADVEARGVEVWKKEVAASYRQVWNQSRDDGTALHKLAEALVYGKPLPDADEKGEPWRPNVVDMAGQLARWFDAFQVEPIVHEAVVFNETHRWAGTLDLVADLNTGDRWLLDYKTTASGVWPESALQLAAYSHASHVQIGDRVTLWPGVDRCGVVWVRPDTYELVPVVADDRAYGAFLHCLSLLTEWTSLDRDELILPPVIPDSQPTLEEVDG